MTHPVQTARRVAVVDAERFVRHVASGVFELEGGKVVQAVSDEESLTPLDDVPAVALLDVVLRAMNGPLSLERIGESSSCTEVVMKTSHAAGETTIHAIHAGAQDDLERPFDNLETVRITVRQASGKFEPRLSRERSLKQKAQHDARPGRAVAWLSSLMDAGRGMASFVFLDDGIAGARAIEEHESDHPITDRNMPGKSTTYVATVVKKKAPGTPVILLSGWVIQQEQELVRESGIDHVLIKPCLILKLLSTVQQALAAPVEA